MCEVPRVYARTGIIIYIAERSALHRHFGHVSDFMKTRQIGICRAVKQLELPRVNAAI